MEKPKERSEFSIPGPQYSCKGASIKTKTTLYMEINKYSTEHVDLEASDAIDLIERQIKFAYAAGKKQALKDLGEMLGVKG